MTEQLEILEGYEEVAIGDEKIGDLAWNVIGQRWEKINESLLVTAQAFGVNVFRFRPIRKVGNTDDGI